MFRPRPILVETVPIIPSGHLLQLLATLSPLAIEKLEAMSRAKDREAIFLYVSVIRGHHAYKAVWTPIVGEAVEVSCEPSNPYDGHAVCVTRDGSTVGHVPRRIRRVFFTFLSEAGIITCEVTGRRKYGKGLEVPCFYKLTGKETIVKKA